MSADVSQPESHPLLLGLPGSGQGESQRGARLRDNDGASFSTSSTAFAETTGTSHGGGDDHHGEDGHDMQPLKASKPPKLDAPRASHEHISKDLAVPRRQFHVIRFWILEILSLVLAACLLSTIAVVLMRFDGKPVATPQWPLGINININTLVALLATFMRACILIVAAAILGQTRWLWYQGPKPRALQDLQDFDSGSRGVAGSLGLLCTVLGSGAGPTTAGTLGMLGAVVTVLSLGIGTFVQQAVNTVNCPQLMPGQRASLPIAYRVQTHGFDFLGDDSAGFAPDLKAAMINGLSSQLVNLAPGTSTHCPTGNCTFINQPTASGANQTHASIALCSRCTDNTKFVKIQKETSNFSSTSSGAGEAIDASVNTLRITFPGLNGSLHPLFTSVLGFTWMIVGLGDVPTSDGHSEPLMPPDIAAVSLANVSILAFTRAPCNRSDSGQEWECPQNISFGLVSPTHGGYDVVAGQPRNQVDILAATCTFYPCLRSYWAEFQSGTLNERVVSTVPVMPASNGSYGIYQNSCKEDFPGKCHYEVDRHYVDTIAGYMWDGLFHGVTECFSMVASSNATGFDSNPMKMVSCDDKWWLTPLWNEGNATLRSVSDTMDNLTSAVTNHWRANGDGPVRADNGSVVYNRSGAVVYGQVWQTTVCLKFEWQWLLLPAGLLAVVSIMLMMVVTTSYKDQSWPVWKENILPMVLYGGIRGGEESSDHNAGRDGHTGEGPDGDGDGSRGLTDLNSLKVEAKETMVVFRRQPSPGFVVTAGNRGQALL